MIQLKADEKGEWQDWIVDDNLDQELYVSQKQELREKIFKRCNKNFK